MSTTGPDEHTRRTVPQEDPTGPVSADKKEWT